MKFSLFLYDPLKERLKNREVGDGEMFPYFLLFFAISSTFISFPVFMNENKWEIISSSISVLLSVAGLVYCYNQNGGSQGYDFIQKYVVLGLVVSVRCLLAFLPTSILLYFLFEMIGVTSEETGLVDLLMIFVFELIVYYRIGKHVGDISRVKVNESCAKC